MPTKLIKPGELEQRLGNYVRPNNFPPLGSLDLRVREDLEEGDLIKLSFDNTNTLTKVEGVRVRDGKQYPVEWWPSPQ
jgi:hypothetical protein